MVNGEDELIRYYHQVLEEVKIRAERVDIIERQIQGVVDEIKRAGEYTAPILKVVDLARYSGIRSEKLRSIKELWRTLEEAKSDLEMAERRKVDVLEELRELGMVLKNVTTE